MQTLRKEHAIVISIACGTNEITHVGIGILTKTHDAVQVETAGFGEEIPHEVQTGTGWTQVEVGAAEETQKEQTAADGVCLETRAPIGQMKPTTSP